MGIFDLIHVPAGVFVFSVIETVVMVLWLNFANAHSPLLAFLVLLVGLQIEPLIVCFVRDQNNRHVDRTQPAGDILIERQHTLARIDDEQNHVAHQGSGNRKS